MSGKGDSYRPIDPAKWDEGWNRIFGKKKNASKTPKKAVPSKGNKK
jgi:hypothetical protein